VTVRIVHGDCLDIMATLPEASIDAIVTDPPYGLQFMGKEWDKLWRNDTAADAAYVERTAGELTSRARKLPDYSASNPRQMQEWHEAWARAALRVLKPGGHLLAFGGTRTYHRLAVAIEDAGFEIRDQIGWAYGQGFPKSLDVSKAIDKAAGAEREVVGIRQYAGGHVQRSSDDKLSPPIGTFKRTQDDRQETASATAEAAAWAGWGTALKPAWEPICVARKPLESPAIPVRDIIEAQLRDLGFGEIRWQKDSANGAAKSGTPRSSSSTVVQRAAEISADHAGTNARPSTAAPSLNGFVTLGESGTKTTQADLKSTHDRPTDDYGNKSSPHTETPVPAAATANQPSSPSTISTAAAPLTERPSTGKSTPKSEGKASQPDTGSFAGIATGLTGSLAHVHINRQSDGSFSWPTDLPEHVPARGLTVAANVLAHGTGAINVDACRIASGSEHMRGTVTTGQTRNTFGKQAASFVATDSPLGRWPANLVHDGSDEVLAAFPETRSAGNVNPTNQSIGYGGAAVRTVLPINYQDSGSAARFFYCAKASRSERGASNDHPTVKPIALMRWLVRLVTPPGGSVLDPFAGSGTTGLAAMAEQFNAVLIEQDAHHVAIIRDRINKETDLFTMAAE
jgi:DNA modification methylase